MTDLRIPENSTLLIIDVQKGIDDPVWGERNNPKAERNMVALLDRWRQKGWPIIHIKHNSLEPNSTYRPHQKGNEFKTEVQPLENETVVCKSTNSAFIGTELETMLKSASQHILVIAGVITNNSVETTVRHAGNLGFETYLVEDACFTFGMKDWHGLFRSADEIHAMSLANLDREYCTVIRTSDAGV